MRGINLLTAFFSNDKDQSGTNLMGKQLIYEHKKHQQMLKDNKVKKQTKCTLKQIIF